MKQTINKNISLKPLTSTDLEKADFRNLLGEIAKLDINDRIFFVQQIGGLLFPLPDKPADPARYYTNSVRDFWNGIVLYHLAHDITDFSKIVTAILIHDPFYWIMISIYGETEEIKPFLNSYYHKNPIETACIYRKLCDFVKLLLENT